MTNGTWFQFKAMGFLFLAALGAGLLANQNQKAVGRTSPRPQANPNSGKTQTAQSPLACNVRALDTPQRARIQALVKRLQANQRGVRELPAGYALSLPPQASLIQDAAEYISLERLCCPFFDFALRAQREGGPVWLEVFGREGVKEFARLEFGIKKTSVEAPAKTANQSPLVCNDSALNAVQWQRLATLLTNFRAAKQETQELPDGYAIRLPGETSTIRNVAEYMTLVNRCSPYFDVALEVGCEGGPVWLKVTGREGVKELARSEFRL